MNENKQTLKTLPVEPDKKNLDNSFDSFQKDVRHLYEVFYKEPMPSEPVWPLHVGIGIKSKKP